MKVGFTKDREPDPQRKPFRLLLPVHPCGSGWTYFSFDYDSLPNGSGTSKLIGPYLGSTTNRSPERSVEGSRVWRPPPSYTSSTRNSSIQSFFSHFRSRNWSSCTNPSEILISKDLRSLYIGGWTFHRFRSNMVPRRTSQETDEERDEERRHPLSLPRPFTSSYSTTTPPRHRRWAETGHTRQNGGTRRNWVLVPYDVKSWETRSL